jgi:hypothetical protein
MTQQSEARVYGMSDQANRHPPAAQGMRGEKAAADETGYRHEIMLDNGKQVGVAEESGVAFAEATGRAGRSRPAKPTNAEMEPPHKPVAVANALPLIIGLAVSAVILALTGWQLRSAKQGKRARQDGVASGGDVGDAVGNGNVWDQPGIGFRPAREIADQGEVYFQPAR